MRAVVVYQLLSLDGVAEEPGDWLLEVDDEMVENLAQVIGEQDDVLLGRGTYEYWADHWPTARDEPFASFVNSTPKHVFTSTPLQPTWAGATVVTTPAADHVAELRARPGRDIGVHGSTRLARSLLRAGLVDELRLVVAPTVAGRGRRLLGDDEQPHRLDLVEADRTPSGLLLLHYRVRREDPPLGAPERLRAPA